MTENDVTNVIKSLSEELDKNPEFKQYLSINTNINQQMSVDQYVNSLGEITNYYHFQVLAMPPILGTEYSDKLLVIVSADNLKLNIVKFLENKLFQEKNRIYEENVKKFSSFLEFMESLITKYSCFPITINSQKIIKDSQLNTWMAKALSSSIKTVSELVHPKNRLQPNSKLFNKFVVSMASKIPANSLISPISWHQNIFDAAVSQQDFIFYNEIQSLIKSFDLFDPIDYINELLEICQRFVDFFELKRKSSLRIMFILLNRFVFDEVYPVNFYFTHVNQDIITPISRYSFSKLDIDIGYFPPDTTPTKTPKNILRKDKYYSLAIYILEEIQFQTNPLDILICVHRSLMEIQKSARFYSGRRIDLSEVELMFKLFTAVILSSEIPEFHNLFYFTNQFINDEALPKDMHFSLAIFIASTNHIKDLCHKKKMKIQNIV